MRAKSKRFLRRLDRHMRLERRASRGGGRRATDREANRGWIPAVALALGIAVLDWAVKWLVASRVPLGELVEVWEGRVAVWHVRNEAMILGLYGSLPLGTRKVIAVVAGVTALLLLFEVVSKGHRLPRHRRPWAWLFVGLAFGGMLGNLGERAVHWGVTDYLSFRWGDLWLPPGNVADLALFLSIPVAAVVIAFELAARMQRQPASPPSERSADVRISPGEARG
jgi:lipoprotein signal peptidase